MVKLPGDKVVVATGNSGKLRELAALLGGLGLTFVAQGDLGVAPVAETGAGFIENALIKARHAARVTGLPALADDSGLAVEALGGAPGVRSARYAGPQASDADNLALLLARLQGVHGAARAGAFHCVMALVRGAGDPVPVIAEGRWCGRVLESPRGTGGFGYDPVFLDPASGLSAAEMSPAQKNAASHRGRAVRALLARLRPA